MTTHIIQAKRQGGKWVLVDITDNYRVLGEETPYYFETRKEAYDYCEKSWPLNSVWNGRRVHGGYRIEVD